MRFILIILLCVSTQAATYYVRDGATGSSGSTWESGEALDTIAAALALVNRGDTVYVAEGAYLSMSLSEAESGTTRITIKKATVADHGTSTGWLDSYGDGQAVFGTLSVTRGYYTIDGQTGGGPGDWETNFGFKFIGASGLENAGTPPTVIISGMIVMHCDFDGGESGPSSVRTLSFNGLEDSTFSYNFIHDSGCDLMSGNYMNDIIWEYNKFARNRQAEPGCHGDVMEYQIGNAQNFTFRYNFFEDIVGSYAFGSHDPTITGYYIYGNIFYWTFEPFFGNFLVGCLSMTGTLSEMHFVNNTLVGEFTGDSNVSIGILRGTGNEAYNNIWFVPVDNDFDISWGNTTHSSNTAYNGDGSSAEQNLTGDPFVNYPTDLDLTSNSTDGTDFSSLFTVDMDGNAFDSGGVWTRGAKAFSDTPPPSGGAPNAYGHTARVGQIVSP